MGLQLGAMLKGRINHLHPDEERRYGRGQLGGWQDTREIGFFSSCAGLSGCGHLHAYECMSQADVPQSSQKHLESSGVMWQDQGGDCPLSPCSHLACHLVFFQETLDKLEHDQRGHRHGKETPLQDQQLRSPELAELQERRFSIFPPLKGCHVQQGPAQLGWPLRAGPRWRREDSS